MKQFNVSGMSCAACSARVERAVKKVPGVTSCSVNLLTNSMGVEGNVSEKDIVDAVVKAGYGAEVIEKEKKISKNKTDDSLHDTETALMIKRFIASVIFLLPLMYVSMGHMMWNWPLPAPFAQNHIAIAIVQMLLTIVIMIINQRFFISGFKSLFRGSPNMDTLVALGSSSAFAWSVYILFSMTAAVSTGDHKKVMELMMQFYFESAAMILTLITLGKMLESRSKGKTTDALKSLIKLTPKTAVILKDGIETEVPVESLKKGDIFVTRPGASIPVDGIVIEGAAAVNEAALTGESVPVEKKEGDLVSAGTLNDSGFLKCEVTRVGEDTTLSQIIKLVSDAAATKAPIAKLADKVSGIFVPTVIIIAAITLIVWIILGENFGEALSKAIAVLVISCPCALGLATPVAIMVGSGSGAKHGILFKTAAALEEAGRIKIAALDKTGTITKGEPRVTDVLPVSGITDDELVRYAVSLEVKSEHPLANAVTVYANENNINPIEITDFEALAGNGLRGRIDDIEIVGGSFKYIKSYVIIDDEMTCKINSLSNKGKTPLLFMKGESLLGVIAVADTIKEDSKNVIEQLREMGIHTLMLTGDNEFTAKAIGDEAGVDEVIAGVLPGEKENVIKEMQKKGKVLMVGDGINDAPALTRADVGMAVGAGTDVAIDAADVVLVKSDMSSVAAAVRLGRAVLRNIKQNLFWAFIYNIIGIPLAAGVFSHIFGWTLSPMFGAAAMSMSSVCVVTNALRLNFFKIKDVK